MLFCLLLLVGRPKSGYQFLHKSRNICFTLLYVVAIEKITATEQEKINVKTNQKIKP